VLPVLKDHGIGAAADRGGLPYARRLDRLDADRSRREQSTEQHPVIAEPDANWLIPVPRLQWLTPVHGHVVREYDLAIVTSNDSFAPGQLDQDGSYDLIVASGTHRGTQGVTARRAGPSSVLLARKRGSPTPLPTGGRLLHPAGSSSASRAPPSFNDEHFCRREQRPAKRGTRGLDSAAARPTMRRQIASPQ
jgi:hypothetical protein